MIEKILLWVWLVCLHAGWTWWVFKHGVSLGRHQEQLDSVKRVTEQLKRIRAFKDMVEAEGKTNELN